MSCFTAQSLCVGYKRHSVLSDCTFSLDHGSVTGILGANG